MVTQAIIPRNKQDPTGVARRISGASNDFARRINGVKRDIVALIKDLPFEVIEVNTNDRLLTVAMAVNDDDTTKQKAIELSSTNKVSELNLLINRCVESNEYNLCELHLNDSFYNFLLSEQELLNTNRTIQEIIDGWFMVDVNGNPIIDTQARQLWFMESYVEPSYQQGTAQEHANLSIQSQPYENARPSVESILLSQPYQARIGRVASREFETMEGFTADTVKAVRQILASGIAAGQNPNVIAKSIAKELNTKPDGKGSYHGTMARARRIARTEITGAQRSARWDEDLSAEVDLGIKTMQMHISALMPTTRHTHAKRHGETFTQREVRDWYTVDGNAINCLCTQVGVVVDDEGEPINMNAIKKALKQRQSFFGF